MTKYKPGKLWMSLGYSPQRSFTIDGQEFNPKAVGDLPPSLQVANTEHALGRIAITFDPPRQYLKSGLYEIILNCASSAKYSIRVTGNVCNIAEHELRDRLSILSENRIKKNDHVSWALELWYDLRLLEKKSLILENLLLNAKEEYKRCEKDLELSQSEMESHDGSGNRFFHIEASIIP